MNRKLVTALPLLLSAALLAFPRSVAAAPGRIIVGTGTPESCTELALQDALIAARTAGGGTIKFQCGPDPVTIMLSIQSWLFPDYLVTLNLPDNTTIDGDGKITLTNSVSGTGSVIYVGPATTVVLKNLTLNIGGLAYSSGYWNAGTLTIQSATIYCPVWYCLYNQGTLRLQNNTIFSNRRGPGTFLVVNTTTGSVAVQGSVFSDSYGVAFTNDGTATINESTFRWLSGDGYFVGGTAIQNYGTLTVRGTLFSNNGCAYGTILNSGMLALRDSTISDNDVTFVGGALSNSGQATIDNSRFSGNHSNSADGGGAIFNVGTLTIRASDFLANYTGIPSVTEGDPAYGGALYNGGALTIRFSRFSGNTATYGGAIANGGLDSYFTNHNPNGGSLRLGNSIITNNAAAQHGGGIYTYGTGTVQIDFATQVTGNTPDDIYP